MPTTLCLEPRCPNPSTYRGRCADHSRTNERATNRAGKAIYNTKRWQLTRRKVLSLQPLCPCGDLALDVDHIVPLSEGGEPYALSNLRGRCKSCHGKITRAAQGGR